MRDRLGIFDLCLPGIVAGMILAGVVLGVGDAMFPGAFQKVFPRETFLLLAVAIAAASVVGFVSLLLPAHGEEKSPKDISSKFPTGGPDVN
jgi:cyanate permease